MTDLFISLFAILSVYIFYSQTITPWKKQFANYSYKPLLLKWPWSSLGVADLRSCAQLNQQHFYCCGTILNKLTSWIIITITSSILSVYLRRVALWQTMLYFVNITVGKWIVRFPIVVRSISNIEMSCWDLFQIF